MIAPQQVAGIAAEEPRQFLAGERRSGAGAERALVDPARRVEAGQVFVNGFLKGGDTVPLGGTKEGGIGREKGLACLAAYTVPKSTILNH